MSRATLRTDGGARGNPGPAGAAFVLERESGRVACGGRFLGETTNNVAEYEALIWGLENARAAKVDAILVLMVVTSVLGPVLTERYAKALAGGSTTPAKEQS